MKMYIETDNRLVKTEDNKKDKKNTLKDDKNKSKSIIESYGLSKNARILTE